LLLGPAAETLKTLSSDEPFDLAFIDADKVNVEIYFKEAKRLVRKGGVIVRSILFFSGEGDADRFLMTDCR